jgi:hypothetical protein
VAMKKLASTLAAGVVLLGCTIASPAAAADNCPNAGIRAAQHAEALPDCRAYELVSPADKAGGMVAFPTGSSGVATVGGMAAVSSDGETAAFMSYQPFGDAKSGLLGSYRSFRTSQGWKTSAWSPAPPSMDVAPAIYEKPLIIDATEDLKVGFLETTLPFDPLIQRPFNPFNATNFYDIFKLTADSTVQWQSRSNGDTPATEGVTAHYAGRSADGSTVLFETPEKLTPAAAGQVGGKSLYLHRNGQTVLVAAGDSGPAVSDCGAVALDMSRNGTARRGAISPDGGRVVFTAPDPQGSSTSADPSCTAAPQVYVRDHGTIVEASASQRTVPDAVAPAHFEDASADGNSVLFASDAALTNDADPSKPGKLYRYDVDTQQLTLLTPDGGVGAVVASSSDARYVYYVSGTSVFVNANGVSRLVADLPGVNGTGQAEIGFWLFNRPPALATPDGHHLFFQTWTQLGSLAHPNISELYVYSADENAVTCVSCNATGTPPLGDAQLTQDGDRGFWPVAPALRSASADGRRLVFETKDALVPRDVNGTYDVYEWVDGKQRLISDGANEQGSFFFNVDESGKSIFFATAAGLVGQDTDQSAQDVYVARVGGGFPEPAKPIAPCTSDCQGDGRVPSPGAEVTTLGERPSPTDPAPRASKRASVSIAALTAAAKARFARTGSVSLKVKVSAATTVTALAQVTQGKKDVTVARAARRLTKAQTVTVKLGLSRKARLKLTKSGSRAVVVRVTASGSTSAKSLRLRLNGVSR